VNTGRTEFSGWSLNRSVFLQGI